MELNQVLMFESLPIDNEGRKKEKVNCLQDMLLDLMEERKVTATEVQKATGIPWGTLHGWIIGDVETQKLDKNILKLAQFFNVSIHYLAFGIGDDEPVFKEAN